MRQFEVRGDLTRDRRAPVTARALAGRVHRDSYVGAWCTTLVWRPDGRWLSRAILLLPDMLPAEDFRRLRVMLRYGAAT